MASLAELNSWPPERASEELLRCCGCRRWADAVAAARPYHDKAALLAAAEAAWRRAGAEDWLEAFSHHPRIGGKDALRAKFAATSAWAQGEQSAVAAAGEAVLDALAQGNVDYEAKFGHIFIICATGKTAPQMLEALLSRLPNDPATERRIAADEQAKITKIRLEKLIP